MSTPLPWHQIDTVLLDMDGTMIDLHIDPHLWQTLVPARYAERLGLPLAEAKRQPLRAIFISHVWGSPDERPATETRGRPADW